MPTSKEDQRVKVVDAEGGADGSLKKKKKKRRAKKKGASAAAGGGDGNATNGADASDDSDDEVAELALSGSGGKGKSGAPSQPVQPVEPPEGRGLDPMAHLVTECCKAGFTKDEVSATIHEMWDAGMHYDRPDAVIRVLRQKKAAPHVSSAATATSSTKHHDAGSSHKAPQGAKSKGHQGNGHIAKPDSKADAQKQAPSQVQVPPSPTKPQHKQKEAPAVVKEAEAPPSQADIKASKKAALVQAASHESVEDALDALVAWTRVAPTCDLGQFFSSEAPEALLRNILEHSLRGNTSKSYPGCIRDTLSQLLSRLLGPGVVSGPLSDLMMVIRNTQNLNARHKLSPTVVATLAKVLAGYLRNYRSQADVDSTALTEIPTLKARIAAAGRAPKATRHGHALPLRDLFALLDAHHGSVSLYHTGCRLLWSSLHNKDATPEREATVDQVAISEVLLQDVLDTPASAIGQKRKEVDKVKAQLSTLRLQKEAQIGPVREQAAACTAQLESLRARREALLRQVAEVEQDMKGLEGRQELLSTTLAQQERAFEDEVRKHDQALAGMMSVVQRAEDVEHVVDSLKQLDLSLRRELAHSQVGGKTNVDAQLQEMFQGFLIALEAYLDLDVRCYEAIKERMEKLEREATSVQPMIAQYKQLGLENNVAEMTKRAAQCQAEASEDRGLLQALQETAQEFFVTLRDIVKEKGPRLASTDALLLDAIRQSLMRMGLAQDWDLGLPVGGLGLPVSTAAPVRASLGGMAISGPPSSPPGVSGGSPIFVSDDPIMATTSSNPATDAMHHAVGAGRGAVGNVGRAPIGPRKANKPQAPPVTGEAAMPKLKWANIVSTGSNKAKSLLDIQAEEERDKQQKAEEASSPVPEEEADTETPMAPAAISSEGESEAVVAGEATAQEETTTGAEEESEG